MIKNTDKIFFLFLTAHLLVWTLVPSPYLNAGGTLSEIDGTPVWLGEFTNCNLVMAIGGIAPRWLSTRTINWSLPFPLIPWTDPLE